MAGTKNDVLVAKNADFSQAAAPNPQSSESNGLITNGQLWIGRTAVNAGGTHISVGNIMSPSGTILIGYSAPNITMDLTGGGVAVDSFQVDASTAPGTNPVVPNGSGLVTITGGQVATGVIGNNVIRTDSLAANTYTIEIQQSTTSAAKDVTKNGVAHFNSAQFTVDQGFVSLSGGTPPTPPGTVTIVDDFTTYVSSSPDGINFSLSSNFGWVGKYISFPAAISGHPGTISFQSVGGVVTYLTSTQQFSTGDGSIVLNWYAKISTLSVTPFPNYTLAVGLGDTSLTNGCFLKYNDAVNSGNWQLISVNSGSTTTTNTATVVTTGWHNFGITINAAGTSVEYFLDTVSLGTIATNIPSVVGPTVIVSSNLDNLPSEVVIMDLCVLTKTLTTPR